MATWHASRYLFVQKCAKVAEETERHSPSFSMTIANENFTWDKILFLLIEGIGIRFHLMHPDPLFERDYTVA